MTVDSARMSALLLAAALLLGAGPAVAQSEARGPWDDGVTKAQKDSANKLFDAGNELFNEAQYKEALVIYQSAIAEWDHPAIRLNMAISLYKMNQQVEAYENLLKALQYGAAPFWPASAYQRALEYKAELEKTVASLEVSCDEPNADVTVDGEWLFTGPDKATIWVRTGVRQVVGKRPDGRTISESIDVEPYRHNQVSLASWPIETRRVLVSRWATWKPWLVTGVGALSMLAGLPLELRARSNMSSFEQAVENCAMPMCEITPQMRVMHDRSLFQNRVALSAFATGGALLITGLTLVVLNLPREETVPKLVVTPLVSENRALVYGTLRF